MRILMLGNSLIAAGDLPALLAAHTGAEVTAHTRGGARLAEHLHENTTLGRRTQCALRSSSWEYIVLQEMSSGALRFPEAYLRTVKAICPQIRRAGGIPVLFATWSYASGSAALQKTGLTFAEMHCTMQAVFARAAAENDVLLANVGEAFFRYPDPSALYRPDGVHPSPQGTQIALSTLCSVLHSS